MKKACAHYGFTQMPAPVHQRFLRIDSVAWGVRRLDPEWSSAHRRSRRVQIMLSERNGDDVQRCKQL